MMEEQSISWIGFSDFFFHLFVFFIVVSASVSLDKVIEPPICKPCEVCEVCEVCEPCEPCEPRKKDVLEAKFGEIISKALKTLEELKEKMKNSSLPIHIDHRPDRLFVDMGVTFKFNNTQIKSEQRQAIIEIGNTFRGILNRLVEFDGKYYHLYDVMQVVVEGHADPEKKDKNDKIVNYIISTGRALEVFELLVKNSGLVPPKYKIHSAGFGEYGRQPKLNATEKQDKKLVHSRMRRVTISISPYYDGIETLMKHK